MNFEERTMTRLDAVNYLIRFYEKMSKDYPENMDELDEFQSLMKSTEMILKEYRDVVIEVLLKNKDYDND